MRVFVLVIFAALVACQSPATLGATCTSTSSCSAPLVCRLGRCRSECSANRDCPVGAQCFLDPSGLGACQLDQDRSCGVTACGVGLTCLGSECVRACSGASDCPTDGVCTIASGASVGVCSDPRTTSDAGPSDDAGIDAAVTDGGQGCMPMAAKSLCIGVGYACAVQLDHTVACWGAGENGELGQMPTETCDTTPCSTHPILVHVNEPPGGVLTGAEEVVCGDDFACARMTTGRVRCWGRNYEAMLGAVGDGAIGALEVVDDARVPIEGATGIVAGLTHACAQRGDSDLVCWGANDLGALGRGSAVAGGELAATATELTTHAPFARVFAMSGDTCVVTTSSEIWCVGDDEHEQLGFASSSMPPVSPTAMQLMNVHVGASPIIDGGDDFACAVDPTGHVECWGWNEGLALGRGLTRAISEPMPGTIVGPASTHVFDVLFHSTTVTMCGVASGTLYCWGGDGAGQAAVDPSASDTIEPTAIAMPPGLRAGVAGQEHSCAIDASNTVWCWGGNQWGELGRGTTGMPDWIPGRVCAP